MQTAPKANVLVVDDDEVVLVAVADLLEEAGYRVVTQQSPIGATQVIVRENIDAAIIDINLPVMQGDNMVRLLSTWDRVKEIPIVIISGVALEKMKDLQKEMPQTRFVPKSQMNEKLVAALEELLSKRPKKQRIPSTPAGENRPNDLIARFTQRLGQELQTGRQSWRDTCHGNAHAKQTLVSSLAVLRGQAQLLGLEKPAALLQSLCAVVEASSTDGAVPVTVDSAVESSMAALSTLERSPTADFAMSPEALQKRLAEALKQLKPGAALPSR